ncbi:hypothetical protein HDV00_001131 [Rhizophlyctis rosea]|nr:hypothetical protein HDV00_001131 [Rhizophlyctis rosea]
MTKATKTTHSIKAPPPQLLIASPNPSAKSATICLFDIPSEFNHIEYLHRQSSLSDYDLRNNELRKRRQQTGAAFGLAIHAAFAVATAGTSLLASAVFATNELRNISIAEKKHAMLLVELYRRGLKPLPETDGDILVPFAEKLFGAFVSDIVPLEGVADTAVEYLGLDDNEYVGDAVGYGMVKGGHQAADRYDQELEDYAEWELYGDDYMEDTTGPEYIDDRKYDSDGNFIPLIDRLGGPVTVYDSSWPESYSDSDSDY